MSTLTEIVIAVRELSFDRFPIPEFILKLNSGKFVTNDADFFKILPNADGTPEFTYTYDPDASTDTLENLTAAIITAGYPIAYSGYFSSNDKISSLLKFKNAPMNKPLTFNRRFYLSDLQIQALILEYYQIVLGLEDTVFTDLASAVLLLTTTTITHMTLWIALCMVDKRRVSELAGAVIGFSYTDGSGTVAGSNLNSLPTNINVNIGSVFSLSDDINDSSNYFGDSYNLPGSDNVLGDKGTFWFSLFLHLRKKIEGLFQDYNFRDSQVMYGKIDLERDINFHTWFDSYPYTTYGPIARQIMQTP